MRDMVNDNAKTTKRINKYLGPDYTQKYLLKKHNAHYKLISDYDNKLASNC